MNGEDEIIETPVYKYVPLREPEPERDEAEQPIMAKRRRRISQYDVREFIRTIMYLGALTIIYSVAYILLDLIIRGHIRW